MMQLTKERMNTGGSIADERDLRRQQQIFLHQQKQQKECVVDDASHNKKDIPLLVSRPTAVSVSNSPYTAAANATTTNNNNEMLITTVHPHDVLCGRRGSNHYRGHEGNKFYRTIICDKQKIYFKYRSGEATGPNNNNTTTNNKDREEKSAIIQSVVDAVRSRNPPGRFLKAACNTQTAPGPWILLDRKDCLAKVGHALVSVL
jgi:hypothetical protein